MLKPTKAAWKQKGVSICSDGRSDIQRRPLINIMVVCESGPIFLKAINCEGEYKDKVFISKLLIDAINEKGHQNVVQVVSDNAPVCKATGLLVEAKPHTYFGHLVMLSLADTRFASTIIMLKRFRQMKKCLETTVISERWDLYKEDDAVKARSVKV
ncbi:hypothetical protein ZIOFF_037251 [Zingiber officinale]|uniref:DUF659 domain-containing protein n=1 Tax=Zingiber officinale TaxID=94328 RepID=A0A8J5GBE3_ZINOF|nr:hypothetical protein ZIOFF_037251 [Zingiber officinale]